VGRVVVIGGGITGLAAAFRLVRADRAPDVLVLEADDVVGGTIRSVTVGGVAVEAGPDSLLTRKPWAVDLCRELGLGDELVGAAIGGAQLWDGRRLVPFPRGVLGVPTDPIGFLGWPGVSIGSRLRAMADLALPRGRADGDRSVGELLRRRLGSGATEALVAPLLGGIVGGDVDRLSAEATFPQVAAWEREHRSLIAGARAADRRRPSADAPAFVRLRGGLERLPAALVGAIGNERVRTGVRVRRIEPAAPGGYVVRADDHDEPADAVIATAPPAVLADLVAPVAEAAREPLAAMRASSTGVVVLVYGEGTTEILPATSGFIARGGSLPIHAATVVSAKWPDPAFGTRAVIRCFLGDDAELRRDDDEIMRDAAGAIARVYGLPPEPEAAHVVRWPRAMPQYAVGHLDRVAAIAAAVPPGIELAGQGLGGVGIADCVRQANDAADAVLRALS
jgi:oxygen-dependent protoporphyrinogen oxidase